MDVIKLFDSNPFMSRYLAYMESQEVPDLYKVWGGIVTVAAALERRVWLDWEVRYFANLYVCLIGPPAARKGTAMKPVNAILRKAKVNFSPSSIPLETLVHKLAHTSDWFEDPENGEYVQHASMLIYAPELTNFVGIKDSARLSLLCELYDALETFEYLTHKHGSVTIENICLSMLTATTPRNLQEHMPSEAIGGGFTSRFIFAYAEQPNKRVSAVPTDAQRLKREGMLADLIGYAKGFKQLNGGFAVSDAFERLYIDWREESIAEPPTPAYDPKLVDYMGRREAHLRKLAMAVSVARSSKLILTSEDFRVAKALLEETERHMPRAMREVGATPEQKIIASLGKQIALTTKGATFEELMQRHIGLVDVDGLTRYLRGLELCKYVKVVNVKGVIRYVVGDRDQFEIPGRKRDE